MAIKFLLFVCLILLIDVNAYLEFEVPRQAFDMDLYKNVLDEELCKDQLGYIVANNSILMAQFLDAGIRTPRGILQGNFVDLGNYHECLAINANFEPLNIEGKYCMLNIPVAQDLELPLPEWPEEIPEFQWPELLPNTKQHRKMIRDIRSMQTQSKLHGQLIGIDTNVMRAILSLIILITILSTCYDFYYSLLKRDSKKASTVGKSFSLYTNTRRLVTYNSVPGALECLDGIRAIAMMWVIVGHTYSTDMTAPFYNASELFTPGPVMLTVSVEENLRYHRYYYINTLTRCTPFFIGMLFGYLLHIFKGKQIRIPVKQDSIYYLFEVSGPINWFLSLRMWKLPARISFAMYIFHYPLMHIVSASAVAPGYFTVAAYFYRFLSNYVASFVVAFMVTLLVDSPFSTLIKLALRGGAESEMASQSLRMAVCVPKACSTRQAINVLYTNITALGLEYTDDFCRLRNDKPFVPGDYTAMAIFGFIILITILCTGYDLFYTHIKIGVLDAGLRLPRGILKGNFMDFGNYHQCLEINADYQPSPIEGKYCMIHVPFTQPDFELPTLPEWPEEWPEWPEEWPEFPWPELLPNTKQHKELMRNIQKVQTQTKRYNQIIGTDMDLMRPKESQCSWKVILPLHEHPPPSDLQFGSRRTDPEDQSTYMQYYYVNTLTRCTPFFVVLDSGLRTPRGILQGNLVDYGNYHECIDISENFEPSVIEGKYCMINVPIVHDLELPTLPKWPEEWPEFPWPELIPKTKQHRQMVRNIKTVQARTKQYNQMFGTDTDMIRVAEDNPLAGQSFRLAVCLPKTCTTKQAIDTLLINTTALGLKFTDEFCRLKNDKPFVPGDYAAMGVFGFIILITILCTGYDIYYTHVLKEDPRKSSTLGKSFSVYNNTRRLLTFNSAPVH
ncbi:hypothetical protein MSG28_006488 [Choristoneura fumiferana]|uniref:Uncharacterized protein n=1 Tax=Choristoneura fumiferana TaxID=7141 RepID=A0ACC0JEZ3_CHOFU|nr:hypothetical protein MSG28_006488 [Choristoneura fumiferana]